MATNTFNFLDGNGKCIILIPGDCIYYSGKFFACGNLSNGTKFNEAVQRLIKCIDGRFTTTTTSTTTTTTTSTSTSTTTTTSTTRTTTTTTTTSTTHTTTSTTTSTTTTSTTSTTTTTTTTTPSATIYWSAQVSSTPPNSTQVQSGTQNSQNPTGDVIVDFRPFNATPEFCWAAIPAAYPKTKWFDTVINNGNIGGGGDLFTIATTVVISGVTYNVYMTQFQTQFTDNTTTFQN